MSNITHNLREQAYAQDSDVALIALLEIDYGGEENIYVARNHEELTSNGIAYEPVAFDITLPEAKPDEPGAARLSVDNVDRRLVEAVRSADEIHVVFRLVTTLDLDVVELEQQFLLRSVTYDAKRVQGELVLDDYLWDRWPYGQYTPRHFRALI